MFESRYAVFIFGVICGMVGSWIMHLWIYKDVDDGKVILEEGYYE